MNPNKIDYNCISENEIIDDGGIDAAFQLKDLPVYVVYRHGRYKKCFSRDTAINRLAHFMTEKVYARAGIRSHQPDTRIVRNGVEMWQRGEVLPKYREAHARCERRIRRLLAHKRKIKDWQKRYDAWVAKRDELMKSKPY
ncbi:hypothetical protein J5069_07555 [Candidatus Symbiopectobacterium sp. NZEC127]|uniref:hypothetical protein n=1 Tax=Candidatus Symbiopectobacterium sp. NZEC127 TaxID=2820472 RepID=UPI0022260615|nr:hypothetical protein [Candidatus Symbiopectobacterium sp. NZEC127]MCW2485752.1 hypothetical protein [Candidatus Symbiopectobacterium sp. NZEC127]